MNNFNDIVNHDMTIASSRAKKTHKRYADINEEKEKMYAEMCHLDGMYLRITPLEYRTPTVCDIALWQNGRAIQYVPKCYQDTYRYTIAVQQNGWAILDIPERHRTIDLWLIAADTECVNHDHPVLHMKTPNVDVIKRALDWGHTEILWAIQTNEKFEDIRKDILEYAVTTIFYAVEQITEENLSDELCEKAVTAFGRALDYLPLKKRTLNVCRLAVRNANNGINIEGYDATFDVKCAIPRNQYRLLYLQ